MNTFKNFFYNLIQQNFDGFSNFTHFVTLIYLLSFSILFLENGIIFAFFLPGDTLLIFLGVLISKDVLSFPLTLGILTIASGLGSWCSYLQGKWLKYHKSTKDGYFIYLPEYYQRLADRILRSYGLFALFIGRFIVFVRTLLPIMIGLSKLDSMRFHFFNWISAFFWIFLLVLFGFFVGKTECIQESDQKFIYYFMFLFVFVSIVITIMQYVRKFFLGRRK